MWTVEVDFNLSAEGVGQKEGKGKRGQVGCQERKFTIIGNLIKRIGDRKQTTAKTTKMDEKVVAAMRELMEMSRRAFTVRAEERGEIRCQVGMY